MNCQDIARIANSGHYAALTETERRDAAAHAASCRHCAPAWAVHARLAQQCIEPMPAELAARVRTQAALPTPARNTRSWRRLTLVGGVVALAAAAGALTVHLSDFQAPDTESSLATLAPAPEPVAQEAAEAVVMEPAAGAVLSPKAPLAETASVPLPPLPLLPAPVQESAAQRNAMFDQALQKAVERHPELVEGPDTDDVFAVGILMREDGVPLDSIATLATRDSHQQASAAIEWALPRDGSTTSIRILPQHRLVPDGRALRAEVRLRVATVANSYDMTRSDVRVLQILGNQYTHLLMPASSPDMNRLTVFLAEDGTVEHAHVDKQFAANPAQRTLMGNDANDSAFLAQAIADRLDIDVSRIGLMGVTSLVEGLRKNFIDADGNTWAEDNRRVLPVYYAWQRRASDTGPNLSQPGPASNRTPLDVSAALRIVEREIPDAFTVKDRAAGQPYVVLSAKGEVIVSGRLKRDPGSSKPEDDVVREWFDLPDFRGSSFNTVRLRNNLGEQADVMFTWDLPPETKAALQQAEAERAAAKAAAGSR